MTQFDLDLVLALAARRSIAPYQLPLAVDPKNHLGAFIRLTLMGLQRRLPVDFEFLA